MRRAGQAQAILLLRTGPMRFDWRMILRTGLIPTTAWKCTIPRMRIPLTPALSPSEGERAVRGMRILGMVHFHAVVGMSPVCGIIRQSNRIGPVRNSKIA